MGYFKVFYNYQQTAITSPVVLTIGNFDGCHLGHQSLFNRVLQLSQSQGGLKTVALTFDPHPAVVLGKIKDIPRIQSIEDRLALMAKAGFSDVVVQEFNTSFSNLDPEQFARTVLVDALKTAFVVVGHDFRFGKNKAGDTQSLQKLGEQLGFEVNVVEPTTLRGEVVSSTRIRKALTESGDIPLANELLGHSFQMSGEVIRGDQRGRTLGFPTANIICKTLLPRFGVYAAWALVDGRQAPYPAVVNIGRRPTFSGGEPLIETHILDERGLDLYGKKLVVKPVAFLRQEATFPGVEQLIQQINLDVHTARLNFFQV